MPAKPNPANRAPHLAGEGTDDAPELPAWCAESGCDACRQLDEEGAAGRQPARHPRHPSAAARLPRHHRARYP